MKKVLLMIAALCVLTACAFAQCASFPCVVATTTLTKQAHGIPPTSLLTPTADGTFRISAYLTTSKPASDDAGEWQLYSRWNDGLRANHWVIATASSPGTNAGNGTVVVHVIAGQPVEYRTAVVAGTTGGMKYDLYIVVEQL